ncbi:hypothetical protein OQA88_73 [Cercophora sp. LCS_1]
MASPDIDAPLGDFTNFDYDFGGGDTDSLFGGEYLGSPDRTQIQDTFALTFPEPAPNAGKENEDPDSAVSPRSQNKRKSVEQEPSFSLALPSISLPATTSSIAPQDLVYDNSELFLPTTTSLNPLTIPTPAASTSNLPLPLPVSSVSDNSTTPVPTLDFTTPNAFPDFPALPVNDFDFGLPVPPVQQDTSSVHTPVHVAALDGKKINHNRRHKHDPGNDPSAIYPQVPSQNPWGPLESGKHKFEYFKGGPELYPWKRYTRDELVDFLIGQDCSFGRKLTIWIQNTPAQVNQRYQAQASSSKCRYINCPASQGTILKGFLRVAFDEHADKTATGSVDPFHNAGYMHLYCFEEIFDLGFLIHCSQPAFGFTVAPDTRHFPHETRNPMSLTRDHEEMQQVYGYWKAEHTQRAYHKLMMAQQLGIPKRSLLDAHKPRSSKDNLWYRLTDRHLNLEVKGRKATREKRSGADIDRHRGDLRMYLGLKQEQTKRKREVDDDGEEEGNSAPPRPPPPKRKSVSFRVHVPPPPSGSVYHQQPHPHVPPSNVACLPDYDWFDANGNPQHQPQERLHQIHTQWAQQGIRRTRKRSRDAEQVIRDVIAISPRLTRQNAHEISDLLLDSPQDMCNRLLAVIPEHAGEVIKPLYEDRLEERIANLPKRQRRDVSGFTEKLGRDPRAAHSL